MMSKWSAIAIAAALVLTSFGLPALAEEDVTEDVEAPVGPKLTFAGLRGVIGVVKPDDADNGLLLGLKADLGTVSAPWIHLALGLNYWSADIDRGRFETPIEGSLSDVNLHTDLRLQTGHVLGFQPFVIGGVGAHFVSADVPASDSVEDALNGVNLGVDVGIGVTTTTSAGLRASTEYRKQFVDDVDNWQFTVGVGWGF